MAARDTVFSMGHGLAARVRPLRQASASAGNCREHFAELRKPARLRNSPQIFPRAPPAMPPAAATAHPPRSRFVESLRSAWPSARNRAAKDKPSLATKFRRPPDRGPAADSRSQISTTLSANSLGLRVPGGKCRANSAPHSWTATTKPSAGRPALIAATIAATAPAHTSGATLALIALSATISA
jgi:hypothetical protein